MRFSAELLGSLVFVLNEDYQLLPDSHSPRVWSDSGEPSRLGEREGSQMIESEFSPKSGNSENPAVGALFDEVTQLRRDLNELQGQVTKIAKLATHLARIVEKVEIIVKRRSL